MTKTHSHTAAVNTLERFDLGGPALWALVRGKHRSSPVLLLIQGGPGLPAICDAAALDRQLGLEEHFRVVYWDQRGAGKSFAAAGNIGMTPADLVADVRALIRVLCERLGVSQVHVVGFSLGASLALLAAAEDPAIRSVVCVGPDVDSHEAERFAYAFALKEAKRKGYGRATRALCAIGEPPHANAKRFLTRVKWVANFGGIHRGKSFGAMMRTAVARLWSSPYYSLREMVAALRGMRVTQDRLLPQLHFDLLAERLQPKGPVAFFQGRHDVASPPHLVKALADQLGASVVWFESSAHMPYEEEPRRFREELLRFVRKVSDS